MLPRQRPRTGETHQRQAYDAATGTLKWEKNISEGGLPFMFRDSNFMGSLWYAKTIAIYDLATGDVLKKYDINKPYWSGCNYAVGCRDLVFARLASVFYFDVDKGREYQLRNIRSGCSNSLIPADGILSAPNYSTGCVCNYAVQTSFALVHMPEVDPWTAEPYVPGGPGTLQAQSCSPSRAP